MTELRIHGFGGQGTVTLAHLLAKAALCSGKQAQALPSFGVERRGAPVRAVVRVSDTPIMVYSQCRKPDILVLMDKKLLDRALAEGTGENTVIVCGSGGFSHPDYPVYSLDAVGISTQEGLVSADGAFVNIPVLGAVSRVLGIPCDVLSAVLREQWAGKAGDLNIKVALRAYEEVEEVKVCTLRG